MKIDFVTGIVIDLGVGSLKLAGGKQAAKGLEDGAEQATKDGKPRFTWEMLPPEEAERYLDFLENGSREGLRPEELLGIQKVDDYLALEKVDYDKILDLRRSADVGGLDQAIKGGSNTVKDGASRAAQYSSGWGNASLQETGISVVYDKKGNYFRIEDTTRKRGRNYLDLDGNYMNNEIVNEKTQWRSKADYQRVTHFNNSDK